MEVSSRKDDLLQAMIQRANMAQTEPQPLKNIEAILQRAANRRRTKIAEEPPELNSLDVSTVHAAREYTWDDLVAGTDLPAPYYNPEDPVINLDESQFVSIEETFKTPAPQPKKPVQTSDAKSQSVPSKKIPKTAPTLSTHFDLPRTNLTPDLKRDLRLLHMRDVLDPKRQYKKQGKFKVPEYSQVGTIIEGPTEFFSARLSKQERSQTFVEETLANEMSSGRFKSRYLEAQERKRSGKKDYYKKLLARRRDSRSRPQSGTKSKS